MEWKILNRQVIDEFRSNHGRVKQFGELPVVILNTIGARSRRRLEVPLITVIDDDEMYLYGTNAGLKKQPAWIYNLRANPLIEVEYKAEKFRANIIELDERRTATRLKLQSERTSQFADYLASAAPRKVAVFKIVRI